jgi:predicted aldo/keto reductase-like oxidoreductase
VAVKAGCYEVIMSAYNFRQEQRVAVLAQARAAQTAGVGMVAMKTMAGRFLDKEKTRPVNCAAALKWALRDSAFTTAIPGYTTFDQMEENVAVLRNLALSPAEEQSLQTAMTSGPGLACDMCGHCNGQCPRGVPVADLMRSYMYSYGYESPALAREEICSLGMDAGPLPCLDCATCTVRCARGFDVQARALDVVRLREIPADFLA